MATTAFVTGGSGFLGGQLIETLTAAGSVKVRALARSDAAAARVGERGAEPVAGDIHDRDALTIGMQGCDVVYHCAARLGQWGKLEPFFHDNVEGTQTVLDSAAGAGVARVVHVSTEAVLATGRPLVDVDETVPRPPNACRPYGYTKGLAEERVLAASRAGLHAVIVRPRFIWGRGDTTLLPQITEACRKGQFAWFGGGHYLTSTCHVRNVVTGMLAAARRGRAGGIYFLTDGPPVQFREMIGELVRSQGVEPPDRSIPLPLARALAASMELAWGVLRRPGEPPLTRSTIALGAVQVTVVDRLAREEIGYDPGVTRAAGIAELRADGSG
jgi:nucleoside-diphosphate-sugar epimerase